MGFNALQTIALRLGGIHPRRWLAGVCAYSRYLGYIKPELLNRTEDEYRVRRQLLADAWRPRLLRAPVGKKLLAISPHADDESIGAGGLLLAHRKVAELHLVCLTDGAGGGAVEAGNGDPNALVRARREEFETAAKALEAASVHYLGFSDGHIPLTDDAANKLRAIVRAINPDAVVLPWFLDGHEDHRRANALYERACNDLDADVFGYEIWTMLEPNAVFDITALLRDKNALIRGYQTQLRTVDYVRYAASLASVRAYQNGIGPKRSGAAEAFVALPNNEYCELVRTLRRAPKDQAATAGVSSE